MLLFCPVLPNVPTAHKIHHKRYQRRNFQITVFQIKTNLSTIRFICFVSNIVYCYALGSVNKFRIFFSLQSEEGLKVMFHSHKTYLTEYIGSCILTCYIFYLKLPAKINSTKLTFTESK